MKYKKHPIEITCPDQFIWFGPNSTFGDVEELDFPYSNIKSFRTSSKARNFIRKVLDKFPEAIITMVYYYHKNNKKLAKSVEYRKRE